MIKRFVIAWAKGTVSLLLMGFAIVLSIGLVAAIGEWNSFTVGLGPIEFLKHTQGESGGYGIASGWALAPLAVILGLVNGLAAVYFGARSKLAA